MKIKDTLNHGILELIILYLELCFQRKEEHLSMSPQMPHQPSKQCNYVEAAV